MEGQTAAVSGHLWKDSLWVLPAGRGAGSSPLPGLGASEPWDKLPETSCLIVAVLDLGVLRENSSSSDSGGGLFLRAADSRADSLSLSL